MTDRDLPTLDVIQSEKNIVASVPAYLQASKSILHILPESGLAKRWMPQRKRSPAGGDPCSIWVTQSHTVDADTASTGSLLVNVDRGHEPISLTE